MNLLVLSMLIPAALAGKQNPQANPTVEQLVFIDELPTTLLPLYASTDADLRAHELIYDRLFYSSPVA